MKRVDMCMKYDLEARGSDHEELPDGFAAPSGV